ncbi:ABC transporter ATP-binding protein [Vampirovibrio chlorellavorus]|uniref:ABC transporter ATP-binding protein n=1 Tax=Vampirovibrio chlorellavorus TaxID=758823 RepID=UPI0026ED98EE|nr:ABC transporter ATP-binding protein [Vampirovibrio chlorellavorus]
MKPNADGTHSTAYLYKRLLHYFKPYWFRAILAVLLTIPIGALDGAVALALKPYVDAMQVEKSAASVSYVPLVIVGFTFLQGLLNYTSIYMNGWLGYRIMCDLQYELFKKLQTRDVRFFDNTATGTIIQAYFQDPQSINTNILNNTKSMLTRLFSSLGLMTVLIATSWKLSIIAISILLLVLFPSTQIRKVIKHIARATAAATGNVLSFYTETVGGIRVVYGYNLCEFREKKFEEYQRNLFQMAIKGTQAQGWLTPSMHIIASVGIALIIWQGSIMVVSKEITTGGFVSFIAAMLMLYNPIKNLGSSILTAQMSLLAAGRIFTLLDQMPTIVDKPDAKVLEDIRQGITFENVRFSYRSDKPVLQDITLHFPKGKTTALVGASGSGKTTIANLIPRFYDVLAGAIRIDDTDIRDLTQESLRKNIAIVAQDNFLFDGTIRENLLMGNPKATDDQLHEALEKAYLTDFIESLPEGLDTRIGERGVMMSGGQRQRMAIARAILKDAPIVILDEATSALDSQSEAIVQKAMDALMVERTVLVIAHRLSTIRNADRIIVLEEGQVAEQGTHEELLAAEGRYANLYQTQFRQTPSLEVASVGTLNQSLAPAL